MIYIFPHDGLIKQHVYLFLFSIREEEEAAEFCGLTHHCLVNRENLLCKCCQKNPVEQQNPLGAFNCDASFPLTVFIIQSIILRWKSS